MKKTLHILLALLILTSAAGVATAQPSSKKKCPTCGKPYSECPYKFEHPTAPKKCSTCGKTIDKCQYKGKHPAKCKTCGKTIDKCQYKGKHPAKCSTCGKTVDKCQYGGKHPKCSTCGEVIEQCQYGGYHPRCSTCGKIIDDCQYRGAHPKCLTCGKVIENCQYGGNHPSEQELRLNRMLSELEDNMVKVDGGTFMMGSDDKNAGYTEKPAHQVTLSSFYICKYEVTQELWQAVMGNNPSNFTGNLSRPVTFVSWYDCQKFITKLNQLTGKHYRLPTDAEWEYAARGGNRSNGYMYSGSDKIDDVAWCKDSDGGITHPVGTKKANELGLYDMSGNVWEWVQDCYDSYSNKSQTNPTGPATGTYRVNRGGGWSDSAWLCRVSYRSNIRRPEHQFGNLGFRLAASSL